MAMYIQNIFTFYNIRSTIQSQVFSMPSFRKLQHQVKAVHRNRCIEVVLAGTRKGHDLDNVMVSLYQIFHQSVINVFECDRLSHIKQKFYCNNASNLQDLSNANFVQASLMYPIFRQPFRFHEFCPYLRDFQSQRLET